MCWWFKLNKLIVSGNGFIYIINRPDELIPCVNKWKQTICFSCLILNSNDDVVSILTIPCFIHKTFQKIGFKERHYLIYITITLIVQNLLHRYGEYWLKEKSITRGIHDWLRHSAIYGLFQGFAKYYYLHFVFAKVSK